MNLKNLTLLGCCILITSEAFAKPTDVIIDGNIGNKTSSRVSGEISLSNKNDASNVSLAGKPLYPNTGIVFDLSWPNINTAYSIVTSNLQGNVNISLTNKDYNYECQFSYKPGSLLPTLVSGNPDCCYFDQNQNIYISTTLYACATNKRQ